MNTELLEKYISGNASTQETIEVYQWIEADEAHKKEFMALRKMHDVLLWQSASEENGKRAKIRVFTTRFFIELAKIAAIILITVTAYTYLAPKSAVLAPTTELAKMQTLYVPAGQRARITLQDGTKVWINSQSTLTFPSSFEGKERNVSLDGEAYFEVAKNPEQPFSVNAQQYVVRALGTQFNLKAYRQGDDFSASLIEGAVEISTQQAGMPPKTTRLQPGITAYAVGDNLKMRHNDESLLLWREGIIYFNNKTIAEMVPQLQRYFDIDIDVQNRQLLNQRFTGKFRVQDGIEHLLRVLQLRNNFTWQRDTENNIITIK